VGHGEPLCFTPFNLTCGKAAEIEVIQEDAMSVQKTPGTGSEAQAGRLLQGTVVARSVQRVGRVIALVGVVLPLLLIGGLKFTQFEVEALKPLIGGTPWLAWMYAAFGEAGTSYLLGVVEITLVVMGESLARAFGNAERSA
jgi:hypothetical protein